MDGLTYREFMEEVRSFIAKLSAEDLRDIILSWASEEESSRRYEFLSKLNPPDKHEGTESEFDDLFDEVEAFALRVQNGDYCDGWGEELS